MGTVADGARGASAAERIVVLDALRGFCLMGILFANALYFSGWDFMPPGRSIAQFGQAATERLWFWHKLLVDGKFYTIFSMLFGLGFALQLDRVERRGVDGIRLFRRRLLVLLGFGVIHLVCIWDGDILMLYALLGLLLPFFRTVSNRALLATAFGLMLLPVVAAPAFQALGWAPWNVLFGLASYLTPQFLDPKLDLVAWLQRPDWASFLEWKSSGWIFRIWGLFDSWRLPKVLGMMLLGMWAGRHLIAGTLLNNRRLLVGTAIVGAVVGLPMSYLYAVSPGLNQTGIGSLLGTIPLALAYAALFILAWPVAKPVLGLLAPAGRMALTNYLTQTLLGIAIYFGIGFGLAGHVGPFTVLAISLACFVLQMLWSILWLRHFAQGPMEWLWRRLTYGGGATPAAVSA
ncbi:DUF418 domain-containing protein [Sphingomonas sp. LT1P40]|uniref:DUF418 domain-containing protein n=1 Tax=Alteristakelama amylovorans TaxID=3096166 RepID=UPI002FC686DB